MQRESAWYPFWGGMFFTGCIVMAFSGTLERRWMECARTIDALTTPSDTVNFLMTQDRRCSKYLTKE